jgi:hypothetical protein
MLLDNFKVLAFARGRVGRMVVSLGDLVLLAQSTPYGKSDGVSFSTCGRRIGVFPDSCECVG